MKLIHTSDWHFGMPVGTGSYEESQRFFLEKLYALIREEKVEALLCAGDIYDSGVTNAAAIRLFDSAATTLCRDLGIKFILIPGNHDSAARLSSCSALLESAGMYVSNRLERDITPILLEEGAVAVYPIPFFNRDEVIALFPEEKNITSLEQATGVVCRHIRETMDPNRRNILMAHAYVVGAELSESDRSARVGFASAVSKDVFEGFDYVALGHIHKPQRVAPHIRYSGSPIKYSFGSEEAQKKGVVLIDTDTMEDTFIPLPLYRDRRSVTGTFEEIMTRDDLTEDYLRITVTDRYAGLELQAQLREKFPHLLELFGKSITAEGSQSALSVEELGTLNETDIMVKFMEEIHEYSPTPEQRKLFDTVLTWSREEGDLG